jgi:hypothetical protein
MKREKISKEKLVTMLKELKSVGKVASELSIPYSTVYSWYKNYGVELQPSCMTIYDELRKTPFSNIHKSVIIGSILGDGSLIKQRHSKNARLQIGHCERQLDYLKWKKSLLNPFVNKITRAEKAGPKIINGKNSFTTGYYIINTIAHPEVNSYYARYYYKGKKRVNTDIVEELDWLSVAIWMADDGSFTFRKDSTYSLRASVATCSFNVFELELLIKALKNFYTGTISIDTYNNTLRLGGGSKHLANFLDNISNVLPKCIHYKLAPQRLHVKPLKKRVKI